ncbi:hypothetical protein MMC30_000913 [Trapelia coarctata]|nr:hypothetical protein [Trapelia coarctata]
MKISGTMMVFLLSFLALMGGSLASSALAPSALAIVLVFVPSVFALPAFKPSGFSLSPREDNASPVLVSSVAPVSSVVAVAPVVPVSPVVSPAPVSWTAPPAARRTFAHGSCGIHLRQTFGDPNGNRTGDSRSGTLTGYILDAWHYPIGNLPATHFSYDDKNGTAETDTVEFFSELPNVMVLKMEGHGNIGGHFRRGKQMKVHFSLGADHWVSSDKTRCKVGGVDHIKVWSWFFFMNKRKTVAWTRDMDCGFAC